MANQTPKMGIVYPSDRSQSWFSSFESMIKGIDSHIFAQTEDRNIIFADGGVWVWDAASGALTWGMALVVVSPSTGFLETLPSGAVTILDGEMMVVEVTRGPTTSVGLVASVVAKIAPDTSTTMICVRKGSTLYFRNGVALADGTHEEIFNMAGPSIVTKDVVLARDGTVGWTAGVLLSDLKLQGEILSVAVREDATLNDGLTAQVYLSEDDSFATTPPDGLSLPYQGQPITLVGHATDLSSFDNVASVGGSAYSAADGVYLAAEILTTSGTTTTQLHVTVRAKVYR